MTPLCSNCKYWEKIEAPVVHCEIGDCHRPKLMAVKVLIADRTGVMPPYLVPEWHSCKDYQPAPCITDQRVG